jgi:hypothetical protein
MASPGAVARTVRTGRKLIVREVQGETLRDNFTRGKNARRVEPYALKGRQIESALVPAKGWYCEGDTEGHRRAATEELASAHLARDEDRQTLWCTHQ